MAQYQGLSAIEFHNGNIIMKDLNVGGVYDEYMTHVGGGSNYSAINNAYGSTPSSYAAVNSGIRFSNQYSVAGLDIDKIPKLKDAINNYIKVLNKYADNLDTTKNTEWNALVKNAIRGGSSEQSAKTYITSICTQCRNQIKVFESFVTALDKLQASYKNQDAK